MLTLDDAGRRVGDRWLWRHLSVSLEPGERLGLAGPSGSGKTLLLRAVVGLDRLDEGRITFWERDLEAWELPRYRSQVLYLPQSPALEEGTVEHNLRLPFTFAVQGSRRFDRERAAALLERLRDPGLLDRDVADLSGGERKRVGFVRALLLAARVLLLDEPTAHVDPERTEVMERMVEEWRRGEGDPGEGDGGGRAVVWTSHDAAQLERVTDRRVDLREQRDLREARGTS
jgi:putative ABC transport system ATP-binding protein